MKSLVAYGMSVALLSGLALASASAQVKSVPVGETRPSHQIRCDIRVGDTNYFATADSRGAAEAKLIQAGHTGPNMVCDTQ